MILKNVNIIDENKQNKKFQKKFLQHDYTAVTSEEDGLAKQ